MALAKITDVALRKAKAGARDYRIPDGGGLTLLVRTNGARLWQYRYRHAGREQILSLGAYPAITLAAARETHRKARELVAAGINPLEARREERHQARQRELLEQTGAFDRVVSDWRALTDPNLAPLSILQRGREVEKYLLPAFKGRRIDTITRVELAALLKQVEARAPEVARNLRNYLNQVFDHAADHGLVSANPVPPRRILAKRQSRNHAALPFDRLPQFVADVRASTAELGTKVAMLLTIMTACRKQEAAGALWAEFDLDAGLWMIPSHRMKARREHVIPLSRQATTLLQELRETATSDVLFPSRSNPGGTMADRSLNMLMRRLGYVGTTVHGFRSLFSTWANERGANPDVIELCLAHVHSNYTRAAYNRAQHLAERRALLQQWADIALPDDAAQRLAEAA